jgi:polysaccharide biosynthesis/export protein
MPHNVLHLFRTASNNRTLTRRLRALGLSLVVLTTGCAGAGEFKWFRDLPASERSQVTGDYVIGVGDQISIRVYEQEALSGDAKIRTDGKIAMPLVGELMVAGRRPLELSKEIERRLKEFVVSPRVTVNVTQSQPISIAVVGAVRSVGTLSLDPPAPLVEALAKSGGLGDYADESKIFVLRQFPAFERIRFTWKSIVRNEGSAASFRLQTGDVVVVEE